MNPQTQQTKNQLKHWNEKFKERYEKLPPHKPFTKSRERDSFVRQVLQFKDENGKPFSPFFLEKIGLMSRHNIKKARERLGI